MYMLQKKSVPRGEIDTVYEGDQICVAWKDNKPVFLASNKYGVGDGSKSCKRYSRAAGQRIDVPVPELVTQYNAYMGGVDLLDGALAGKRPKYRMKKWWFSFWPWCIGLQAVQGWKLRMKQKNKKEPYLSFLRELVIGMFHAHGKPPYVDRALVVHHDQVRYDGLNHLPVTNGAREDKPKTAIQNNCRQNTLMGKRDNKTVFKCEKCNVPLHINLNLNCFKDNIYKDYIFG